MKATGEVVDDSTVVWQDDAVEPWPIIVVVAVIFLGLLMAVNSVGTWGQLVERDRVRVPPNVSNDAIHCPFIVQIVPIAVWIAVVIKGNNKQALFSHVIPSHDAQGEHGKNVEHKHERQDVSLRFFANGPIKCAPAR